MNSNGLFFQVGDGPGMWRRSQLLVPEEPRFQCLYCGAQFSRLHQLAAHEAGHIDPVGPVEILPTPSLSPQDQLLPPQFRTPTVVVN